MKPCELLRGNPFGGLNRKTLAVHEFYENFVNFFVKMPRIATDSFCGQCTYICRYTTVFGGNTVTWVKINRNSGKTKQVPRSMQDRVMITKCHFLFL